MHIEPQMRSSNPVNSKPSPAAGSLRPAAGIVGLIATLVASVVAATAIGVVSLPYGETARILAHHLFGIAYEGSAAHDAIIWSVRFPRVVAAGLVGLALGLSGAVMQGLFRNPMASPGIVGVSSGASVGAVIAIFLGWQSANPWSVPVSAFIGALIALMIIFVLATHGGRTDTATLLLAGLALSALFDGAISLLYHFVDDGVVRQIVYWLMGNLGGKRWEHVGLMTPFILIGSLALWAHSRDLNIMLAGDDEARSLGVPVERIKRRMLILIALVTGAATSVAGMIGFVGLIVPHMLRYLTGPDHRWLLPASGLGGAILLILADLIARTAFSPIEIRPGIVTAFLGVPFFLYLLVKRRELVRWT